jgi:hypothetical protein
MATIYRGAKASLDLIAQQKSGKAQTKSSSDTVKVTGKKAPAKKTVKKSK